MKKIKSEYLFYSHSNNTKWKKLSRVAVEEIVKTAGIKAWITNPVWPHKLRHTFATSLLRRWGNIYYIKKITRASTYNYNSNVFICYKSRSKKTQNLLQTSRAEQYMEEEQLDPMPENIIIKDQNILNQFRILYQVSKEVFKIKWTEEYLIIRLSNNYEFIYSPDSDRGIGGFL